MGWSSGSDDGRLKNIMKGVVFMKLEKEYYIRYWIAEFLRSALRCAKSGLINSSRSYLDELQGLLYYLYSTGDISEDAYNKLVRLKFIIIKQYGVY